MGTWKLTRAKAEAWVAGHQKALVALDEALGEGILVANGGYQRWASGFMMETFKPTLEQIGTIQAAAAAGVVNQVGRVGRSR